jgi:mono/diheme cytochrome c family protein
MKHFLALAVLALQVALPCSATAGDPPDAGAGNLTREGKTIYARQCSRCHGFNMNNKGLLGFDLRKFPKDGRDRFVSAVSKGKPPKMPPWGDVLSATEIDALWAYVQAESAQ